jgi:hypothetical protein
MMLTLDVEMHLPENKLTNRPIKMLKKSMTFSTDGSINKPTLLQMLLLKIKMKLNNNLKKELPKLNHMTEF